MGFWDGFWQNLASNMVVLALVSAGGFVIARLRAQRPQIAPTVMYGLVGSVCIALLIVTVTRKPLFSFGDRITTENLEQHVRGWANDLGMGVNDGPVATNAYFTDIVTQKNGRPVMVVQAKERAKFLQIESTLTLSPEHQVIFEKLSPEEKNAVTQEVMVEMARSRIGYEVLSDPQGHQPMAGVHLMKGVPIDQLTQASFVGNLDELDSAVSLVRAATELALIRHPHIDVKSQ